MRRTLLTLLLALCLYQGEVAYAGEIVLLSSLQDEHHSRYRKALERALAPVNLTEHQLPAPGGRAQPLSPAAIPESTSLLIAAGARACSRALALPRPPVLCVFITEATYQQLARQARAPQHSALYLEQPLSRQLNLARLLLPPEDELSVLLPAAADEHAARLEAAAKQADLPLSILRLPSDRNPASLIQQTMDRDRMLLALPEPAIYNRHTIHGILLTTYRKGIAVIGFSESFVAAGAIAAVHSTPEDMAGASAAVTAALRAGDDAALPPPAHSSRFSVSVNRRVARSLHLDLPPETRLRNQLLDMESENR